MFSSSLRLLHFDRFQRRFKGLQSLPFGFLRCQKKMYENNFFQVEKETQTVQV